MKCSAAVEMTKCGWVQSIEKLPNHRHIAPCLWCMFLLSCKSLLMLCLIGWTSQVLETSCFTLCNCHLQQESSQVGDKVSQGPWLENVGVLTLRIQISNPDLRVWNVIMPWNLEDRTFEGNVPVVMCQISHLFKIQKILCCDGVSRTRHIEPTKIENPYFMISWASHIFVQTSDTLIFTTPFLVESLFSNRAATLLLMEWECLSVTCKTGLFMFWSIQRWYLIWNASTAATARSQFRFGNLSWKFWEILQW